MQNLKELTGQQKYDLLRSEYKDFIFDSYEVEKNSNELDIKYNFVVPGLAEFHPHGRYHLRILKIQMKMQ